jgi:molybdenum cofactor cytidylyltransferase
MTKNLSAVILGTRSGPRLKTPIALLPFGETTVLNRTLASYVEAGFAEVVLVLGTKAAEIRESLGGLAQKVRVVETAGDDRFAPMLRAGLEGASGGNRGVAVGLGDQPLLTPEILTLLAERFESAKAKILVPVWHGSLGLPMIFHSALTGELRSLEPDAGSWDVLRAHGRDVLDADVPYAAVVRRIEDRADYHEMLRVAGLPVPEPPPAEVAVEAMHSGNGGQPEGPGTVATFGGDAEN